VKFQGLRKEDGVFIAATTKGDIRAKSVLLATGRRGAPRKLGVPGDDSPHVASRLDDPSAHAGLPCVVVGGGDAALEAALALAELPDTKVFLVHRGANFDRSRVANRQRLASAEAARSLTVLRKTKVLRVHDDALEVQREGAEPERLPAARLFALLGAEIPVGLLKACGIQVRTHYGDKVI